MVILKTSWFLFYLSKSLFFLFRGAGQRSKQKEILPFTFSQSLEKDFLLQ